MANYTMTVGQRLTRIGEEYKRAHPIRVTREVYDAFVLEREQLAARNGGAASLLASGFDVELAEFGLGLDELMPSGPYGKEPK